MYTKHAINVNIFFLNSENGCGLAYLTASQTRVACRIRLCRIRRKDNVCSFKARVGASVPVRRSEGAPSDRSRSSLLDGPLQGFLGAPTNLRSKIFYSMEIHIAAGFVEAWGRFLCSKSRFPKATRRQRNSHHVRAAKIQPRYHKGTCARSVPCPRRGIPSLPDAAD